MLSIILAIALHLSYVNNPQVPKARISSNSSTVALVPFNIKGMPVTIRSASARNSLDVSYLEYSVSNLSAEEVTKVDIQVFIVDADHKLLKVKEGTCLELIAPGATLSDTSEISSTIDHQRMSFVAVTRVVGRTGVWQIDPVKLEKAVRARLNSQSDVELEVSCESHVTITKDDRSEIFKLILEAILSDERKAEHLQDRSNVILLSDGVDFNIPPLRDVSLVLSNLEEIQKFANAKGKIIYLIYRPFDVEGSRVFARMALRDRIGGKSRMIHVPFKYTFLFTCVKKDGRWIIEESTGYAQS